MEQFAAICRINCNSDNAFIFEESSALKSSSGIVPDSNGIHFKIPVK